MAYPPPPNHYYDYVPGDMRCSDCGWLLSAPNSELHYINGKKNCPGEGLENRIQRGILGMLLIVCAIVVIGAVLKGLVWVWENLGTLEMILGLVGFYFLWYFGLKLGKYFDL